MGHTIPTKRIIIYKKLSVLTKFAKTIRLPYRTAFLNLVESVYKNISSIIYTNSLDDDEMIIYAMLVEKSSDLSIENKEKIMRCLAILITK